jgi:ribosomal protein S18 acetylase RimI-like enzyme
MKVREATVDDAPVLAELNRQLIEDEGSLNRMTLVELEARMRAWLRAEYRALLFTVDGATVAYALFRPSDDGIHLRQFFVVRAHRRRGYGLRAIALVRERFVPRDMCMDLDVLIHNERAIAFWRACGFREHAVSFRI